MSAIKCPICPRGCSLEEGQTGFCKGRANISGKVIAVNYGRVSSIALDPIEKKPLAHFHRGMKILSVGSYGCNLRCPFCQNYSISQSFVPEGEGYTSPEFLVKKAEELVSKRNIGLAYTYNEPLIGFEFVRDCSRLIVEKGLKNVVVTNGYVNEGPLTELLPMIHAFNIDLKGFTEDFYELVGGRLDPVKRSIELASRKSHVEVTTLIIPGLNDSEQEMRELSSWLASVDRRIPLHVTRFFPAWKMTDRPETPVDTVYSLAAIAREKLLYVHEGNV
jgi:pyruvate formate lyase activating enzyme